MEMMQCKPKSGGGCSMGTNSVATAAAKASVGKVGGEDGH